MKKFLNFGLVYMMIAISSCMFLSSCSDDDEEEGTSSQTGVWLLTHVVSDDGSYDISSSEMVYRLTLKENGSFSFYFKDADGEETEEGSWSYANNYLILKSEANGTESMQVISWTEKQLVLLIEDEEEDEPAKWTFTKQ